MQIFLIINKEFLDKTFCPILQEVIDHAYVDDEMWLSAHQNDTPYKAEEGMHIELWKQPTWIIIC